MSKTPSLKLYNLIKSLSRSEKRYFKLQHQHQDKASKYLLLFEGIEQQEDFDDDELKEFVYQEDDIQSRKYSELKSYTYDLILKRLQSYDDHSSIDYKIAGMLKSVRVLYKRAHYDNCKDILGKVKKLAKKYERYIPMLEILKWEKQIAYAQIDVKFLDKHLDKIDAAEQDCFVHLQNLSEYQNLFFRLLITVKKDPLLRDEERKRNLQKMFQDPLLNDPEMALSHEAKVLFYRIYSIYYYNILDFEKYYLYTQDAVALMETKPHFLKEDISDYISALSNYTQSCGIQENYDEVEACLKKFKDIKPITLDDEIKIHRHYYGMSFSLMITKGEFKKGLNALNEHLEASKHFGAHNFAMDAFYFQYFKIYFGTGNFDKAHEYLNLWLNLPRSVARQDLQSLARTLNLIIHYEMGNDILLDSLLRSTYRFQKKRNRLFEFEKVVITFIREAIKIQSQRELQPLFQALKKDFIALKDIPAENVMFKYFDFIGWVKAKADRKSFATIVKERYKNRMKVLKQQSSF